MSSAPRVAVISRVPRPGQTKRRLALAIGDAAAVALHCAFVTDELAALAQAGLHPVLAHPSPAAGEEAVLAGLAATTPVGVGVERLPLPGVDLAGDLRAAVRALCRDGAAAAVVAADVPHLSGAAVAGALHRLSRGETDVVLGPSPDGGYWMIATRIDCDLFSGIPMGTGEVFAATRARADSLGLRVALAEPLRDIDTVADLTAMAPHLPVGGRTRALLAELVRTPQFRVPLPTRLHIEITNRCNSPCETCVRTTSPDPEGDLSAADVERLIDGLPLRSAALQVNGEATLHPELSAIIRLLVARGVDVELNTNAIALRGARATALLHSGLRALNVSMDGATPATYRTIRGVDAFATVVANTAAFLRARAQVGLREPRVGLWMTASRHNLPELPALVDLAARIGADEVYLQRLVYFERGLARGVDSLHGRLGDAERAVIAEAEERARRRGIPLRACGGHPPGAMLEANPSPEPWRSCRRPWESAVVMADGDVVPCCISTFVGGRAAIRMGNALREPWPAVWNSDAYRRQRAELLAGAGPDFCRSCGRCWSL